MLPANQSQNGMMIVGDTPKLRLVSAGGEELPIVNNVKVAVKLSGIEEVLEQSFIVVKQLISQVILGIDFLQQQGLVLDFTTSPVSVTIAREKRPKPVSTALDPAAPPEPETLQVIWQVEKERRRKVCIVASLDDPVFVEADECAICNFKESANAEFHGFVKTYFEEMVRQARDRFVKTPGLTKLACHQIGTVGPPARVAPRK